MEGSTNGMVNLNAMSAKHRAMADDYASVSSVVSKVATVQAKETAKKPVAQNIVPSVNSTKAFPTLGETGGPKPGGVKPAQWLVANKVNSTSFPASSSAAVSAKKKPAPAPNLKDESNFVNLNALTGKKSTGGESSGGSSASKDKNGSDKRNNNNEQAQPKQGRLAKNKSKTATNGSGSGGDSRNNKENETVPGDNFPALGSGQVADFALANLGGGSGASSKRGPPGFENVNLNNNNNGARKAPGPPPGFSNVTLNSVARHANNLTFTSSSGESYNILPGTYSYVAPSNSSKRNQVSLCQIEK